MKIDVLIVGGGPAGLSAALILGRCHRQVLLCDDNKLLTKIKFKSGPDLERAGLFFSTGCHQASDLSQRLGCKRDEKGGVVTDPATEETSVPGVYVAGDVSRDVLLVSIAIAEGAKAAVAINKALLRRDGFCD
jgi:thioredoxin reductase